MPHRRSSPPLLSPPLLIILFPIVTLTLLFLALPPFLATATRLLRPASVVKTSWDSLNILLVVCAILCGVFARRNHDEPPPDPNAAFRPLPSSQGQSQWFGFQEETKLYDNHNHNEASLTRFDSPATGFNRFRGRRTSSSYPDLRHWDTGDHRYKSRFFDDYEIHKQFSSPARDHSPAVNHRQRLPESTPPPPQPQRQQQEREDRVKEIPVDTFEVRPSPPPAKSPAPPPPPPPPPPPESSRRDSRRTHRKIERESEITVELDDRVFTPAAAAAAAPPPSPPPPPSVKTRSERKKSNVKREIAMVWASVLSNQRKKKKKQRAKNNHNHDYDDNVDELPNNTTLPPSTPPPPPPPPPPSVFHTLFRKGLGKSKKIHSVSPPPPPPPPPPSKRKNRIPPPPPSPPPEPPRRRNSGRPPLPNRTVHLNYETTNAGNQSPLIPVPPPPPPFKVNAMKFVVRGDFVKIRSNQSSRCSSPERDDVNASEATMSDAVSDGVNNGVTDRNVFCPSPDVNVKAATFIARLRGEWRLEKLNSLKEKGNASLPLRL